MKRYERTYSHTVERGALDLETGHFPMVLATEGEASDGHIISIRGLTVPERMPLLFAHWSDTEIPSLGSVVDSSKGRKDGGPVLRATGRINLNGDDVLAETRRGIAQLVHDGDLGAVSIRWTGTKVTPRTELPKGHKHHVASDDEDPAKRWGLFFEESRALEGSVVAIGADPQAVIGRSEATDDPVARAFFLSVARGLQDPEQSEAARNVTLGYARLQSFLEEWRGYGFSDTDLAEALGAHSDQELESIPIGGVRLVVGQDVAEAVRLEREQVFAAIERLQDSSAEQAASAEQASTPAAEQAATPAEEAAPKRATFKDVPVSEFFDTFGTNVGRVVGEELARVTGRK